jgi:hypothetical protein
VGCINRPKVIGKLKVQYEYSAVGMNERPYKYRLYFIVDSINTILYNKRKYYRFIFSTDSLKTTGYINYNQTSREISFIPFEYEKNKSFIPVDKIQTFSLYKVNLSKEIYRFGELGSYFQISTSRLINNRDYAYEAKIIKKVPVASDMCFITKMFYKDNIYPELILFFDPFSQINPRSAKAEILSTDFTRE